MRQLLLIYIVSICSTIHAAPPDPMKSATFNGLKIRSIGPALTGGRIGAFAVHPKNRSHYYAAVASGGVWKTTNAGTTWTPIFDSQPAYSIGTITLDEKNPNVLWVGTGENNSQRSVSYGKGVFRSNDGGKTWRDTGLNHSEHIGKILIDPRDSNVVYVAAQGPLWNAGGERGLYKTTNGAKGKNSWKRILNISEHTGINDIVLHPKTPDVLLASAYQRRRRVWTLINGGPESGIYRSKDAGKTWTKITRGLPNVDMGRIGLAFAPSDPKIVYALIESIDGKGGVYRSTNQGETWQKQNSFDEQGQYYGEIFVDPVDPNRIYIPHTYTMVSDDGGKTLSRLGEQWKHVDTHAFWIDPKNPNYYLSGCDGGIYESYDRGKNWRHLSNLPLTQFYDITVDNDAPFYHVYGGTQDNFTLGGPARTQSVHGIINSDWFVVKGGDGFQCKVDPTDPAIVYCESQYGVLARYNRRTGEMLGIQPQPMKGEKPLRWNWDSPLVLSKHNTKRLYFAAQRVFQSNDRGSTWKAISEDLTQQLDRDKLEVMGKIWSIDTVAKHLSTSPYGTIVALSESPIKEGLLYAGTDDGLIQITDNGGTNWTKIEQFPNVPKLSYVARVLASSHDENTVYAAFDNHKSGDFTPYLLRSKDRGKTWKLLTGSLKAEQTGPVLAIAEDPVNANLVFIGTEFGLYFTIDGGNKWLQLKNGIPTISVRDLAIQKEMNDLAIGTFGRGIYILDDYSPLREITAELVKNPAHLFTPSSAWLYVQTRKFGLSGKGFRGASFYTASNPPFGATLTYYLAETIKTSKAQRREQEKKGKINFPNEDQLRHEANEERPLILLAVTNSKGEVMRTISAPATAGLHRVTWDLREPAPLLPKTSSGSGNLFATPPGGIFVVPGKYRVSMSKRVNGIETPLGKPVELVVKDYQVKGEKAVDHQARYKFQHQVAKLERALLGTLNVANDLGERLLEMSRALDQAAVDGKWKTKVRAMQKLHREILRNLRGDRVLQSYHRVTSPSVLSRLRYVTGASRVTLQTPTQTQRDSYQLAAEEFTKELARLRKLLTVDVKELEKVLESSNAPWTPGRLPNWSK